MHSIEIKSSDLNVSGSLQVKLMIASVAYCRLPQKIILTSLSLLGQTKMQIKERDCINALTMEVVLFLVKHGVNKGKPEMMFGTFIFFSNLSETRLSNIQIKAWSH